MTVLKTDKFRAHPHIKERERERAKNGIVFQNFAVIHIPVSYISSL